MLGLSPVRAAVYHLDATLGDDHSSGISVQKPWRTLERLNKSTYQPGDQILLKRGEVFYGQINPKGSGTQDQRIYLGAYGDGERPIVDARGEHETTVLLRNLSYWTVKELEVRHQSPTLGETRKGLRLVADQGVVRSVLIRDLMVRDVNGVIYRKRHGSHGIQFSSDSSSQPSYFDSLIIEDCHLIRCDRNGIHGGMHPWLDLSTLSQNVVIRNNIIEDVGGDAIVVVGCEGAIVERNRVYGARQRFDTKDEETVKKAGASIGIWPLSSTNTIVRFNEVWGYKGVLDGQGYDADINTANSLFEYNFSSDNEGGFALICNNQEKELKGTSIGNRGTIMRYNISYNDHLRGLVIDGSVRDATITKNIFYNTIHKDFPIVIAHHADANLDPVHIEGNIFYVKSEMPYAHGKWAPEHGYGIWGRDEVLTGGKFSFANNAYHRIKGHKEPRQKNLPRGMNISELIKMLSKDQETKKGFDELMEFMQGSRYWNLVKDWR
jgi:hypothetical protein